MMTPEQEEVLTEIFRVTLKLPDLVLRDDLMAKDVPEWDSFNHISLIFSAEDKFGIMFQVEEVASVHNVGELKSIISNKVAE